MSEKHVGLNTKIIWMKDEISKPHIAEKKHTNSTLSIASLALLVLGDKWVTIVHKINET